MTVPTPDRALRLALVGWGLGDLAMGRSRAGMLWLALEVILLAATTAATLLLFDTTWYLVPFLLGVAFFVIWAVKAVTTYRRARHLQGAAPTAPVRSPAGTIAWLCLPLLAWGTGFWLVGATAATPAAATDQFVAHWAALEPQPPGAAGAEASAIDQAAAEALFRLQEACDAGRLSDDCDAATKNLLRDVRMTITQDDAKHATAQADLVEYQRQPRTILGVFEGSELVAVPVAPVLTLDLEAEPAALGAERWIVVNAQAP